MNKIMRIGRVPLGDNERSADLFVKWEINESGTLSISGVIGPKSSGNASGGCGQICMEFAHRNPTDNDGRYSNPIQAESIEYAQGWTAKLWLDLLDIWEKWHMNDMRACCEHQRAEGWDKRKIDPTKPLEAYGKHFPGQRHDSLNMLAWVRRDEHPEGLLCHPCPVCGYKYGSEWKKEALPNAVVDFLKALPEADTQPAWI